MAESVSTPVSSAPALPPWNQVALDWVKANPLSAALSAGVLAIVGVFYAAVPMFSHGATILSWAWSAWNPETRYEHAKLVPFIILFLVWNAIPRLRAARVAPDNLGWIPLAMGIVFYLLSARTLQPRIGLLALPFLCLGIALYLGGRQIARTLLFPIACLFFLIPVPGLDQATVRLQLFATQAARVICNAMGLHLVSVGTTIRAVDQSFNFEIAGDCSGINSLMAITLMTAIFAHMTQETLWKKLLFFAGSVPVAIIGNIARLVAIMIVAKCFGQKIAGGWFHDVSAYIVSFPFAFVSLCLLNKLLNWRASPSLPPSSSSASSGTPPPPAQAVSYDY
jgi:exosortase